MQRSTRQLLSAAIVSLVLHFLLGTIVVILLHVLPKEEEREIFDVALVTPERLQKPIVVTPKPDQERRPDKADYNAEHDQKVERESQAHHVGPSPNVSEQATPNKSAQPPSGQMGQSNQKAQARKPVQKREGQQGQEEASKQNFENPSAATPGQKSLLPSWKDLEQSQAMPFNDHLPNVEQDAKTRLNTWKWKHATFFVRLKQAVSRAWNPSRAIRKNDPSGQMFGGRNRTTVLRIAIDHLGEISSLSVLSQSGVYYLDDEALRAFRESAPFPNPPVELFEGRETFEFSFSFLVTINKGFDFDMDWGA